MSINNPWVTPLQRSYDSIKAKLIASIRERIPEMNDFTEGNIFVILLSIYAAVAEVLHYYIDNMAREAFLPTARRYSSVYNHAKLVDYHIKCAVPSTVDILLYLDKPAESDIAIPISTFTSTDGKPWQSTKEVVLVKGSYSVKIPLRQIENRTIQQTISYTSSNPRFILGIPNDGRKYAEGSMSLKIGQDSWILVDTFAYSGPNDKVFKVEPDENLYPTIIFGDNKFGKVPNASSTMVASFNVTYGKQGNVPSGSFTSVPSNISKIDSRLKISSPYAANGGSDYEDFESLKSHIPLSIKSLGVAITKDDYESLAKLVPGVNKAYVNYRCGKYIEIYITPDNPNIDPNDNGWGQASEALIDTVESRLNKSKVITTNILVGSTHAARIYIDAEITGKKSYNSTDIINQVKPAILEAYNYNTSDINKPIRLSDLYSLIDNLSTVDYLKIHKLYILPYPRPKTSNQPELEISSYTQHSFKSNTSSYEELEILFVGPQNYQVRSSNIVGFISGIVGENLRVDTKASSFNITIGGSGYQYGYSYSLYVQDMNSDIVPHNYNIPIFLNNTINLTIHEVV